MNLRATTNKSLAGIFLIALLAGCAANKVDWNARIGSFTFDQAVMEFGPPDKQAKLENGMLVADWLTRRGYSRAYVNAPIYSYGYYGPSYGAYTESYAPDYFLRLTFGSDGKLSAWKKFAR